MKLKGGVYKITCTGNNKIYVGSAVKVCKGELKTTGKMYFKYKNVHYVTASRIGKKVDE